jgi:hypothetical protein
MLVALEQGIASGQVSWMAVAALKQKIRGGMPWPDAILEVQQEEQQRQQQQAEAQAQAAQQAAPGGAPGGGPADMQMGAASQPGLGGGPAPVASVPPPQQGVLNVASMVRALHAGTRGPAG